MNSLGRIATITPQRQLYLNKQELAALGVKPSDKIRLWTKDGLGFFVIYKLNEDEKDAVATKR